MENEKHMELPYLLRGILIGLIFGVPAGAIGVLCIQHTAAYGFWNGLLTGLGSTLSDILYACVSVFGISLISDFLTDHAAMIRIAGSLLIAFLGIHNLLTAGRATSAAAGSPGSGIRHFAASFIIALSNPATVMSFLVAFSSFGITEPLNLSDGLLILAGIAIGTGAWWLLVSGITARLRGRITDRISVSLRRILGGLLIGFGLFIFIQTIIEKR